MQSARDFSNQHDTWQMRCRRQPPPDRPPTATAKPCQMPPGVCSSLPPLSSAGNEIHSLKG